MKFGDIAINSVAKKMPEPEDVAHYIGLEHIDSGTFTISRWGAEVVPIGTKLLMKKGDVLFGRRRAYQRKVAIAPFDGIFSAHGMVLRPKTDVVDERYFPFFIASDQFMGTAVRISVGGLSPTINWKTLKECEFDLPSLERQRELADLLWAANDLKEAYKKAITASEEMLKAKFREMFGEYGVRSEGNGAIVDLQEVAKVSSGLTKSSKRDLFSKRLPYLRVANVFFNYLDMREIETIGVKDNEIADTLLQKNDLLFVEGNGSLEQIGRVALWDGSMAPMLHQNHIIKARFTGSILPKFALYYFMYPEGRAQILEAAKATTGLHTLSTGKIKRFKIPLPPLPLQRKFVAIAEAAEEAKAALKRSLGDLEQVMKGLING